MKKTIVIISGILQFVAAVSFVGTIRGAIVWKNDGVGGTAFFVILTVTIISQVVSTLLKNKYPDEVAKATDIVATPKNSYGWIALGFFGLVVLFVIIMSQ